MERNAKPAPRPEPSYEPSRPAPPPPRPSMPLASAEPASLYPATLKSSLPTVQQPYASDAAPAPEAATAGKPAPKTATS